MIARNSIRWRLMVWLGFLLASILTGFGVTAYQLYRTRYLQQIDQEVEQRVAAIGGAMRQPVRIFDRKFFGTDPGPDVGERQLVAPGRPADSEEDTVFAPSPRRGPPEMRGRRNIVLPQNVLNLFDATTNGFYFVIWNGGRDVVTRSTNAPAGIPYPQVDEPSSRIFRRQRGEFREGFYFNGLRECVLVGRLIRADQKAIREFGGWLLFAGLGVLGVGVGGVWWLATRALKPVDEISAAATRIAGGKLSERINVAETESELGKLAGVLNSTFARLETAFAQQKQFTADASHELRTPLAVMISEAQMTLARDRSPAEYKEAVEICLQSAQQMKALTSSLMELARWDAGQETIVRSACDLATIASECVERLRPLAKAHNISIECECVPAQVLADAERLGRVVTNLITNAITYNKENGNVVVRTAAGATFVTLTIQDSGQGIGPEDLPHIFKRFYRADKSRGRAEGHSGLGLAICKTIVEAHGGAIEAQSEVGVGTKITVRLPGVAIA